MRFIQNFFERGNRYDQECRCSGFYTPLLVAVFSLLVLLFFWALSSLGPKRVDYTSLVPAIVVSEEVKILKSKSLEMEARFEEILALRDPNFDDLQLLQAAIDYQNQYLDQLPNYSTESTQHLEVLKKRFQEYSSEALIEDSIDYEAKSQKLLDDGEFEAASLALKEAFQLQKKINELYPLSSLANPNRATRLLREVRYLDAEPLARESLEAEKLADSLVSQEEWKKAEQALVKAMQIQERLNSDFRGTKQDSVPRYEQLSRKLEGIRSGQYKLKIIRLSNQADALHVKGETLEAAYMYEEVARMQRKLNEQYPESPDASSELVSDFERKSQTSQSYEIGLAIEADNARLRELLGSRRTYEAAEVIVDLRHSIQRLREVFPRSSLNNPELELKIRYLNLIQSDLAYIQDRIYDLLLPIPEVSDWQMMRTETSQALYSLIMGTNPSRNIADLSPVDSVSWKDAKTFCQRLSWIMGCEVRLPTEEEYRLALGRLRYLVLEEHAWGVGDGITAPRTVASKKATDNGFHDLLGNVSEWLESVNRYETEKADHIGGHIQDRMDVIFTVPMRSMPRVGRNRLTGFRAVVKVSTDSNA